MQSSEKSGKSYVPEPQPLFIAPPTLVVTTFVPYAILALVPSLLDVIGRGAGFSNTARAITSFVMLAICGIGALLLLLRNWRVAFHDVPTELRPITILELWEQRASGDGAMAGSQDRLAIIAGFGVMLLLSLLLTVVSRGLTAIYCDPLSAHPALREGARRGALCRLSAAWPALHPLGDQSHTGDRPALRRRPDHLERDHYRSKQCLGPDGITSLATPPSVSLSPSRAAWIRLRSGSVLAAVAFQLLLLLLGIAV